MDVMACSYVSLNIKNEHMLDATTTIYKTKNIYAKTSSFYNIVTNKRKKSIRIYSWTYD